MVESLKASVPKRTPVSTFGRRLGRLVRQPAFLYITALGNGLVLAGSVLFHSFEYGVNPAVSGFLDSLHWSVAVVSSVGFGNIAPVTSAGKVIAITLMMGGTLFLWSYMALFVGAFVAPDLDYLGGEIDELESDLSEFNQLSRRELKTQRDVLNMLDRIERKLDKISRGERVDGG